MVGEPALLREPFPAHLARVGALPGVDAHVPDERVVDGELALADLAPIRLLVGVRPVVEGQLKQ